MTDTTNIRNCSGHWNGVECRRAAEAINREFELGRAHASPRTPAGLLRGPLASRLRAARYYIRRTENGETQSPTHNVERLARKVQTLQLGVQH